MIRGETVVVWSPVAGPPDPFGAPTETWVPATVENVLVSPGPRGDVEGSTRPDGKRVAWTLHFPKTWSGSLKGCEVSVRGEERRPVVGDPKPYTPGNTPTPWNMPVELEGADG